MNLRAKIIIATIVGLVLILAFVIVVASFGAKQQTKAEQTLGVPTTANTSTDQTLPRPTPEQIAKEAIEDQESGGGDAYLTTTTVPGAIHAGNEGTVEPSGFIPLTQLPSVYPRVAGQMSDVDYNRANATMIDVIRAKKTNVGREKYPNYFSNTSPTPVPIVNFVGDFANTTTVPGQPGMYRTVVVWHGADETGITFKQVRIAMYSLRSETGVYSPIKMNNVPYDVTRSDSLVDGVSITG